MEIRKLMTLLLLVHQWALIESCEFVQQQWRTAVYECISVKDLDSSTDPLDNITSLDISGNNTEETLRSATFSRVKNVSTLRIHNTLHHIEAGAFNLLDQLDELYVVDNDLRSINADVFSNLPIRSLQLMNNRIVTIHPGSFANMTRLSSLYLDGNHLRSIAKDLFNGLLIEKLSLANCSIHAIEQDAFKNMANLERLFLNGNKLKEFYPLNVMDHFDKLKILWLHENQFTFFDRAFLEGLANLEVLNLQGNTISYLSSFAFNNTAKLRVLSLANNNLNELNVNSFPITGLPALKHLYLDHNRLNYLAILVQGKLSGLTAITIAGNPWYCTCLDLNLRWLKEANIRHKCDDEYFSGRKPVCIATDDDGCPYQIETEISAHYVAAVRQQISKKLCIL